MKHGTCGFTSALVASGATPIKNWLLAGEQAFPGVKQVADGDAVIRFQTRKYGCANCPIACGGICEVSSGKYPVGEVHKPNRGHRRLRAAVPVRRPRDDHQAARHVQPQRTGHDLLRARARLRHGMLRAGHPHRGGHGRHSHRLGHGPAMVALLDKVIRREGIGDLLADGVKAATLRIGRGSAACAVHVGGQEPGLHNALFLPSRGTGFVCDPTPGRHTAAPMARLDGGPGPSPPIPNCASTSSSATPTRAKAP